MGKYTVDDLTELQRLPLAEKIELTKERIEDWYMFWQGRVFVSFSGGKDSTVLLHIARQIYPDIKAVFCNTGLEYPEVRSFALSMDRVHEVRPRWGKAGKKHGRHYRDIMTFQDVVYHYGYPIISKEVSGAIDEARKNKGGQKWKQIFEQSDSKFSLYRWQPLYNLPFKISNSCCYQIKKKALQIYSHKEMRHAIIATLTEESRLRTSQWLKAGCNEFTAKEPVSKPMSFWTEQDIYEYILLNGLSISPVYGDIRCGKYPNYRVATVDDIEAGEKFFTDKLQRTGCMFCGFGTHLERGDTRFQQMYATHRSLYDYCIGGGEWMNNPEYNADETDTSIWNPKKLWVPSKDGLGLGKVFDMVNQIYGEDFIRYKP